MRVIWERRRGSVVPRHNGLAPLAAWNCATSPLISFTSICFHQLSRKELRDFIMAAPEDRSDFHVLVIGAGPVGLLIAQRLKMLGIKCTVFERERYLNERPRDWSFGIFWAQSSLRECLPISLLSRLNTAQIDPLRTPSPDDYMRLMNGKTAEELSRALTPHVYRLKKSSLRALLAEGIDVQVGYPPFEIERQLAVVTCLLNV